MLNTLNINLKTDIKTDRPTSLPITLMSQDKNNNQFILRFTNGGEPVNLDNTYTVEILTKFKNSGASRLTSATVRQDYATWEFDTAYITQDEEVRNYVYVRKSGSLVVSADANCFVFSVDLSEIDKGAGKVAETYDENYQKYLDEFKGNVDFEEIAQAEQARREAELLREENYNQKVDTAIVEADVVEKVDNKVTELAPQINNLTTQLAQKADEIAQLNNVVFNGQLKPYYVENLADFNFHVIGVPTGAVNYEGGNFFLGITGNEGEDFVTVTSGNIADAGISYWGAVIKDDNGNWETYSVTGSDGVSKLNIYPHLKTTITNGEIGNLYDEFSGQHYTERGYFALAQHIYKSLPKYTERNKYLAKFKGTDTETNSPWTLIGNPYVKYALGYAPYQSDKHKSYQAKSLSLYCGVTTTPIGAEWTQNVVGQNGFLETFIGSREDNEFIIAEFYLDGILQERVTGIGKTVDRLVFPFKNATNATFKVFIENSTSATNILINDTTWWINEKENQTKILPPHSKVVYLGDSWGAYHNKAITRELERLLTTDTGTAISVINPSVAGMTSAWGKAWFKDYVLTEKPTHAIIEFFVNDYNTSNNAGNTYVAPDGVTYSGDVTKEQWRTNIRDMCQMAIDNGIQPIVITPCSTASSTQTFGLSEYNVYLVEGVAV